MKTTMQVQPKQTDIKSTIIDFLKEQYLIMETNFSIAKNELKKMEKNLDVIKSTIKEMESDEPISAMQSTILSQRALRSYNVEWSIYQKVIYSIANIGHVVNRRDISAFIKEMEPDLNMPNLDALISNELFKLKNEGHLKYGRPANGKIKGFLYGDPSWFNEVGAIKEQYLGREIKQKYANINWN